MSEEEKMLRVLLATWEDFENSDTAAAASVALSTDGKLFKSEVVRVRFHLAKKDAAKERTTKIVEIYSELSEVRRKTQLQQGALLGWLSATRKMKRLSIPVPHYTESDWDCLPASAPSLRGEILEGEHSPTYIAASWTGEWEVWGWKDGTYWSHHGKVSRKAIDERVESVMNSLYRQAAADIGRAENQPVDIRVVGGTVEELEAEIDRLQRQNENQAQMVRVLTASFYKLQSSQCDALKALLQSIIKDNNDAPSSASTERNKAIASLATSWPVFGAGLEEGKRLTEEEYELVFAAQLEMRMLRQNFETSDQGAA